MGHQNIVLEPGQQRRIVFQGPMYLSGSHNVEIGDLKGILRVTE